jgi:hypothetical protein
MIENILTLLSYIYVQKYDCMNDKYFFSLIDRAFTLTMSYVSLTIKNESIQL